MSLERLKFNITKIENVEQDIKLNFDKLSKDKINSYLALLDALSDDYDLKSYDKLISLSEIQDRYKRDRSRLSKLSPKGYYYMYYTDSDRLIPISKNNLTNLIKEIKKELKSKEVR